MDFFTKKESIIVIASVFIIGVLLSIKAFGITKEPKLEGVEAVFTESPVESVAAISPKVEIESSSIMVHISGEVYNPGIYELIIGDRVVDVVNMAGGLTKQADLDRINLAKKINDEDKIYIPGLDEEGSISIEMGTNTQETGKININIASSADLQSLPGIGEVIAGRIVEYRKTSKFKNIEDILDVSGIGDAKFEAIKDMISIN
ncbi:MAG: ComEA family DNA-binding protein [Gudongella sp.]|nr:ComEA family DNA-binding protein [Gudongella sp.]